MDVNDVNQTNCQFQCWERPHKNVGRFFLIPTTKFWLCRLRIMFKGLWSCFATEGNSFKWGLGTMTTSLWHWTTKNAFITLTSNANVEPALFGMIERACVSSKTCCMKNNFARTKNLQHKVQHHAAMILSVEVQDYFWKKIRTQHIKFLPTMLLDWLLGGKKQTWFATSVCGQVKIYHAIKKVHYKNLWTHSPWRHQFLCSKKNAKWQTDRQASPFFNWTNGTNEHCLTLQGHNRQNILFLNICMKVSKKMGLL